MRAEQGSGNPQWLILQDLLLCDDYYKQPNTSTMIPIRTPTSPYTYASLRTADRALQALSRQQNPVEAAIEFDKDPLKTGLNAIWMSLSGNDDLYHDQKEPKEEFVIALLDAFSCVAGSDVGAVSPIFHIQDYLNRNYQCQLRKNGNHDVELVEICASFLMAYSQLLELQIIDDPVCINHLPTPKPEPMIDERTVRIMRTFSAQDAVEMKKAFDRATTLICAQFSSGKTCDDNDYVGELARSNQFQLHVANKILANVAKHDVKTVVSAAQRIVSNVFSNVDKANAINRLIHALEHRISHKMAVIGSHALFILNNKTLFTEGVFQCVLKHIIENDRQYTKAIVQGCVLTIFKNPALFTAADYLALKQGIKNNMPFERSDLTSLILPMIDHDKSLPKDIVMTYLYLLATYGKLSKEVRLKMGLLFFEYNRPFFITPITDQEQFKTSFNTPIAKRAIEEYSLGLSKALGAKVKITEYFSSDGQLLRSEFRMKGAQHSPPFYEEKTTEFDSLKSVRWEKKGATLYFLWRQNRCEAVLHAADRNTLNFLLRNRFHPALLHWNSQSTSDSD